MRGIRLSTKSEEPQPRSGLALEYQSDQADAHSRDSAAGHGFPDGATRVPTSDKEWGNAKAFHDLNSYRHGVGNCGRLCLPRGVPRREDSGRHRGYISLITDLFLRLIKMIIAPLVLSTLIVG